MLDKEGDFVSTQTFYKNKYGIFDTMMEYELQTLLFQIYSSFLKRVHTKCSMEGKQENAETIITASNT